MPDYVHYQNRYYIHHRLDQTHDPSSSSNSICIQLSRNYFNELRKTLDDGTTVALGPPSLFPIRKCITGCFELTKLEEHQATVYEVFSRMLSSLEVEEGGHPQIMSEISTICSGIKKIDLNMKLSVDIDVVGEYMRDLIQEATVESQNKGTAAMVPATKSAIFKALKIERIESKVDNDDVESCTICMDDLLVGVYVSKMPCSHRFHRQCIVKWLKTSHFCPVCRFEIPC